MLEALTCGNTEIPVHDLRITLSKLSRAKQGANGYSQEFQVKMQLSSELTNKHKPRLRSLEREQAMF